jgi:pimeloyl-[acyl-carrier protein] methyl ester esterase
MSRVWLPGWHFKPEVFDALRSELSGGLDEPVLSYAETNLSRADWLAEQVEALDHGVTLVGWSLGGMLACELASLSAKVKAVYVLNANLQFAGASGLEPGIAQAFLARYEANPASALRRFVQLMDPAQSGMLEPFLQPGNHLASLRWLYDIDLRQRPIACPVHLLLAHDDRLVPYDKASQAWVGQANSVTGLVGEHSLPQRDPSRVADWLSQHG